MALELNFVSARTNKRHHHLGMWLPVTRALLSQGRRFSPCSVVRSPHPASPYPLHALAFVVPGID